MKDFIGVLMALVAATFIKAVLMALVTVAFIKGGLDIYTAIEAGESPRAVVFDAIPMFLIGAFALLALSKTLSQMAEAEKTQSESSDN
jgi:hypothetical protein